MCGIAGYIGRKQLDNIDATLALMHRRGPDQAASRHFVTPQAST